MAPDEPTRRLSTVNRLFFGTIFAALAYMTYLVMQPYLSTMAFALLSVVLLKPGYDYFLDLSWVRGRPQLATVLTVLLLFLVILIPVYLVTSIIFTQAAVFLDNLTAGGTLAESIEAALDRLNDYLPTIDEFLESGIVENLREFGVAIARWLANAAVNFGLSLPELLTNLFIFVILLWVLLPAYDRLIARMTRLSPLDAQITELYIRKATVTVSAMIKGVFVISVVQGLAAGATYVIAGVPYAGFWTLVATVVSVIPLIGVSLVSIPIGLVLILTGKIAQGLFVMLSYWIVIMNIDNVLRPRFVSKEAYLNPALVIISVLGGLRAFGFLGLIYGPIIVILLLTTVDVYSEYYAEVKKESAVLEREAGDEDTAGVAQPASAATEIAEA